MVVCHQFRSKLSNRSTLQYQYVFFQVLIFVTRKDDIVRLVEQLRRKNFAPLLLHGDMFQDERNTVLAKFRKDPQQVLLVATDVAGSFRHSNDYLLQRAVLTFPKYAP